MMKPSRIEAVVVTGPTQLRIAWTTGERLEVDLAEPIHRLKALAPLRDPAVFGRVQVGDWGRSWFGRVRSTWAPIGCTSVAWLICRVASRLAAS